MDEVRREVRRHGTGPEPNRAVSAGRWLGVLFIAALGCWTGCGLAWPRWSSPGSLPVQRERAVLHDPYADRDLGPEVVSGRPRDFLHPLPQAERNRQVQERLLMQGGAGR